MDKPILTYDVRQQENRASGGVMFVPFIDFFISEAVDAEAGDRCEVRLHDVGEWSDMPDGDMTVFDGTKIIIDQTFWSDMGWDELEHGTEVDFRLTIGGESKSFTAIAVE